MSKNIKVVKTPSAFSQNVINYFQTSGVNGHLQARFLAEIAGSIQQSNAQHLSPLLSTLTRRKFVDDCAIQIVIQYLIKMKMIYTLKSGENELPNIFKKYNAIEAIANPLKLPKDTACWLSNIIIFHQAISRNKMSSTEINISNFSFDEKLQQKIDKKDHHEVQNDDYLEEESTNEKKF
ncbi:hypothetical protein TRFO_13472 [Tritrichomonas foetus]|uniref:Uncharacterized protein n=1 Tax=Tritrichomonas foetus TaxID=1144522 RepID=A0A1J4L2L6_9EUKA|nr:hypothetical protein TRFO_13472 [Tritrichomonas foetus]|eukprot:OHT16141.1 hypothetical protein TRFO_13472 [Tritrichomonas foetus]